MNEESNKTTERVAALYHVEWANWLKFLFSKCEKHSNGDYTIPKWIAEKWQKEMGTEYFSLSEDDKNSDRKEAKKFVNLILQMIERELKS